MMVVVGFSRLYADFGFSNAVIQSPNPSRKQLSTLYWLTLAIGAGIWVALSALALPISGVFGGAGVEYLLPIAASAFFIDAMTSQYRSLLTKDLRFRAIAISDIASALVGLCLALFLAWKGYGAASLVYASVAQSAVIGITTVASSRQRYACPALVFDLAEAKPLIRFGLYQIGERTVNYASANADKFFVGKFLGVEALGIYEVAWRLVMFPLSKINPIFGKIAFPVYAKLRDNPDAQHDYYRQTQRAVALCSIPALTYIAFFSREVVSVLFGEGWVKAGALVTAMAIAGIAKSIGNPGGALVLANGRADVGFYWNLAWCAAVVAGLSATLAMGGGLLAVGLAVLVLNCTVGLGWHLVVSSTTGVAYTPIVVHTAKIGMISLGFCGAARFMSGTNVGNPLTILTCSLMALVPLYMLYIRIFETSLWNAVRRKN